MFGSQEDKQLANELINSSKNYRVPYRHSKLKPPALLAFAIATGFRNIQTILQYLRKSYQMCEKFRKLGNSNNETILNNSSNFLLFPFEYVEVMACPKG